jgi:hypothetical protein
MAQKRLVAPDTSVRSFPTPNIDDLIVFVDVDSRLPGYKPLEYGSPHPDQNRFPKAKLVYQEPIDGVDQFVRRIYATDRVNQDSYNYAIRYSGGSTDHPIYIRNYIESRVDYKPLDPGTFDPLNESAVVVEEEAEPVEGELSSLYFNVTRVFESLPGPIITSFNTNEAGQKVTVTTQRKSKVGYVMPEASATSSVAAQSEDVDVVTEQISSVPEVFSRKQFSTNRPDVVPQKFRAAIPDVETSEVLEGEAEQPELNSEDILASETQQTQFTKQVSRRSRSVPSSTTLGNGTIYTKDLGGGVATVTEKYGSGPDINPGYGTVDAQKEELGDGNFVVREIVLSEPPELVGQEYDEQLDVVFPFTEKVVQADGQSTVGENRTTVSPQDVYHSVKRQFDIEMFRTKALEEMWSVPAYIEIDLPDVLESVEILFATSTSQGGGTGTGSSYSVDASSSITIAGDARIEIKNGYRGPIPATRYVFFLDKNSAGAQVILTKTNSQNWPALFTKPETISIAGGSVTTRQFTSFTEGTPSSTSSTSNSTNFSADVKVGVVTIQPTLHSDITISRRNITMSTSSAAGSTLNPAVPTLTPEYTPTSLPATVPAEFPTGDFLVSVNTESYKYGLVRVSATVAHITSEYV